MIKQASSQTNTLRLLVFELSGIIWIVRWVGKQMMIIWITYKKRIMFFKMKLKINNRSRWSNNEFGRSALNWIYNKTTFQNTTCSSDNNKTRWWLHADEKDLKSKQTKIHNIHPVLPEMSTTAAATTMVTGKHKNKAQEKREEKA